MDNNLKVDIWLVGNTGLRNPNRIQEGLEVYSKSKYLGRLGPNGGDTGFTQLLTDDGIIHNENGKDSSGSHARKWRLMFERHGFVYPEVKKKDGKQEELGCKGMITPCGKAFLKADTLPAIQDFFLRGQSVEQWRVPDTDGYFSPLRWILAIMLKLEQKTGSSEIQGIEFALWGHATDPRYDADEVVDNIIDLRERRKVATSKRQFDKKEIETRGENYAHNNANFKDYCDMNMRYLMITGMFERKGKGLSISPAKHTLAENLAKTSISHSSWMDTHQMLCDTAPLPTDNINIAKRVLRDLENQMHARHIAYDISDLPLTTAAEVNIARRRLEGIVMRTNEIQYAEEQPEQWEEISDYMTLLINGKTQMKYNDDSYIKVPKDETPAYLEWTLWRAALAIDHLINQPYEVRGFKLDSDFLPVSAAGGGKGDLYCEFQDFMILIEVTMSTSSRQESMEGEPVRRHVSDAVAKYDKPVYCLFIANKIDTNTAETFRNSIWYTKENVKQRLEIVPLTLSQFQKYFNALFENNKAQPEELRSLILQCESKRDNMEAPEWESYINRTIDYCAL